MSATTTTPAVSAPVAPVAPSAVAPWDALRTSLSLAGAGKNFVKASEAFDALASFAKSAGHPFQPSRSFRDNILRLVSLSGKGKASGLSVKWSVGFSFGTAGKDYIAGAMDSNDKSARKAEVDSMKSAGALWKAVGGLSFELEA
jgi:hypothetical protein